MCTLISVVKCTMDIVSYCLIMFLLFGNRDSTV